MWDLLRLLCQVKKLGDFQIRLMAIIFISVFIASCATSDSQKMKLKMAWKSGPPTRHAVSLELASAGSIRRGNGETKPLNNINGFKASYTQTIADHQEGLLVSFSDFEIPQLVANQVTKEASDMQNMILKITSLALGTRADFIMSPDGEFIRLHQFEQFKEA